jgi:hypothetical protein
MAIFDNPPLKSRRHPWWIAAAGLALLALAYALFWFSVATKSRDAVLQWVDGQRAHGFTVRYDSLITSGFPFSIRLRFINPGMGAPHVRSPWGWEGASLELLIKPWNLQNIRATTSGPQMLAIPFKRKTETYNGVAALARLDLKLAGGEPETVHLLLDGIELKAEIPGLAAINVAAADLIIERLETGKVDYQTTSTSVSFSLQGVTGPWLAASPLGGAVQNLVLEARQMGSFDEGPLVESLENWRDSGGTVEIGRLNIQHGPMKFNADGTVALDDTLQPIGALTARIEGFFETIDALQRLGAVTSRNAITAKMVLGVLSRKSSNGGPAHLNLALSAQSGRLYAGPIALMEMPKVDWRGFKN